jgi:hypothetical protein
MWKALKAIWGTVNALSTATWLWGLPWATAFAVSAGWLAAVGHVPTIYIGLSALTAFAVVYVIYVAFRVERLHRTAPRIPQQLLDQATLAAARHWFRPGSPGSEQTRDDGLGRHMEKTFAESAKRCPELPMWKAVEHVRNVIGDDDSHGCYPKARAAIRQAALEDRLEIWGRKELPQPYVHARESGSAVWTRIAPDYWHDHELASFAISEVCQNHDHTWVEANILQKGSRYWELKVRKAQVERLWEGEAQQ